MSKESFRYNVKRCARCGGDHNNVEAKPLTNALDDWKFWAMCPELGEPFLVAAIVDGRSLSPEDVKEMREG